MELSTAREYGQEGRGAAVEDPLMPPWPPAHNHRSFVPGYEPSAPPLPAEESFPHHNQHEHQNHIHCPCRYDAQPVETLGAHLLHQLSGAFHRLWGSSHTVLRLEIRRGIRVEGPVVRRRSSANGVRRVPSGDHPNEGLHDCETSTSSSKWLTGIQGGGARLKLMQIWDFPDRDTGEPSLPWNLNFGFGARIKMDKGGRLEPLLRLQAKHAAVQMLPTPVLELRGKWPLGATQLAVNVHYRVPILHMGRFWESPSAQLLINLYCPLGTGFHLTPGGLEFDEHVVNIGKHTKMRVAAAVYFPRQFPLEEGEQPIRVQVHRLGLKTRIS